MPLMGISIFIVLAIIGAFLYLWGDYSDEQELLRVWREFAEQTKLEFVARPPKISGLYRGHQLIVDRSYRFTSWHFPKRGNLTCFTRVRLQVDNQHGYTFIIQAEDVISRTGQKLRLHDFSLGEATINFRYTSKIEPMDFSRRLNSLETVTGRLNQIDCPFRIFLRNDVLTLEHAVLLADAPLLRLFLHLGADLTSEIETFQQKPAVEQAT